MKAAIKIFRVAIVTAVLWGIASSHTGTMGPIDTYAEAVRWAGSGVISEAFRTFWSAAEMFFYRNDLITAVGLLSVAVHCGSVIALLYKVFLCRPQRTDDDQESL